MPTARPDRLCPNCRKPATERWKPFCSERCRNVDLGRWLGGEYRVPVKSADHDEDGDGTGLTATETDGEP